MMSSISKNGYEQVYNVYPTKFLDFADTALMKYDTLQQFINTDNFTLTHSAFIGIGYGKITIMPRIKSIINWDKLQSNLLNHQQEAIKPLEWFNNISYKNHTLTAGINVAYKNANFEMNSFLPFSNQSIHLKNNNASYKENKIVFEPDMRLSIKSITNIIMSLHADRKLNYPTISSLHIIIF